MPHPHELEALRGLAHPRRWDVLILSFARCATCSPTSCLCPQPSFHEARGTRWSDSATLLSLATLRDRCCNTSAFVLPRTDGCPLLQPFLKASSVRVAIDGATVGRTDEERICPWVRTAGSPEWLAGLDWSISDFNLTHSCSPK